LIVPLLEDSSSDVRWQSLQTLSVLEASASADAVLRRLSDSDRDVRIRAAACLCVLGRREGIPLVLRRGDSLDSLNAVRKPDLWKKLSAMKVGEDFRGSMEDLLGLLEKKAGLRVEYPTPEGPYEQAWRKRSVWSPNIGDGVTWLDVLQNFIGGPIDFVLEEGVVRLLPRTKSRIFWKEWWAAQKR
jgi:hypothetical protein